MTTRNELTRADLEDIASDMIAYMESQQVVCSFGIQSVRFKNVLVEALTMFPRKQEAKVGI